MTQSLAQLQAQYRERANGLRTNWPNSKSGDNEAHFLQQHAIDLQPHVEREAADLELICDMAKNLSNWAPSLPERQMYLRLFEEARARLKETAK